MLFTLLSAKPSALSSVSFGAFIFEEKNKINSLKIGDLKPTNIILNCIIYRSWIYKF